MDTERNLLFGVLALQADLIDAVQFAEACTAWSVRKELPLAELLIERGWITREDQAHVEYLLQRKLKRYGGDVQASLAAVADDGVRRSLAVVGDAAIQHSLANLTPPLPGADPWMTRSGLSLPEHSPSGRPLLTTFTYETETRDRYRLLHVHAVGGIGQVWLSRDSDLGRTVALKELRPEAAESPKMRARFLEEARITGQLEHPGIVPVYELARRVNNQQPFYTMRFLKGRTLTEAVRIYHQKRAAGEAGPLDLLGLLNAFVAVCNAMAYAHARGVIHRDLKGQNVVLGDFGEVIVLDWGLAKVMHRPTGESEMPPVDLEQELDREQTLHGQVLGTPAYMAPEQAAGRQDLIDSRTDVYGLGAVLYEILTGRPPFTGADSNEVLQKVQAEEPARPSQIGAAVPPALEAVCLRALAKKPADRYPSAADLAKEVQRWLADEPVAAYRGTWWERMTRWARHHRTAVASAAVALVLVVTGGVGGLFLWQKAEHRRERQTEKYLADLQRSAEDGEIFASAELRAGRFAGAEKIFRHAVAALKDEPKLDELRSRLDSRWQRTRSLVEFYRLADRAEKLAFLEYDVEALAACEDALTNLGMLHDREWAAHLPAAELTDPADADPERLLRQLREDVYRTIMLLAALRVRPVLMKKSDDPVALETCRSALEAVELCHHYRASFSGRLVELFCYLRLGQLERILAWKPALEPTSAADYYFSGMAHVWLAAAGKDDSIRRLLELPLTRALSGLDFQKAGQTSERYLQAAADREPRHYWTQFWLAWSFAAAGNYAAAAQAYDTCVALRPDYALAYAERGAMLIRQMPNTPDADRRRQLERRGLEDLNRAQALEPDEPFIHWQRAGSLRNLGRMSEALEAFARAMELERPLAEWKGQHIGQEKQLFFRHAADFAKAVTARDPGHAEAWADLATAELALGHFAEARTAAGRALELRADHARSLAVRGTVQLQEKQFEPALADFRHALSSAPNEYLGAAGTAKTYLALDHFEESLAAFDHVLKIAITDWQRVEAHLGRARSLLRLGRMEEARRALESARQIDPRAGNDGVP